MKLTQIMNENQENRPLSNEVKKHFLEIVSTYNKYQEMMDRKSDLATVAETLGGITEAARTLAIHEGDDWFDKHTIKRNMSELDKLGKEFDKCAKEATSLDQRLGGLYEDMGHILSRYYKMGEITEEQMKERLGMNESVGCGCGGTTEGGCGCGTHTHEPVNEAIGMDKSSKKKVYNQLKKGDKVRIKFGNAIRKGNEGIFVVSKGKTVVGKSRVERITLKSEKNPNGVKYYLYNRNNNIGMAQGDMGAVIEDMEIITNESVNEGKKRFRQRDGIGKAKYTISYHDGKQKHKDGSDFFGIQIFKNKKDLGTFRNTLLKKGYIEESVNEGISVSDERHVGKKGIIIMIDDNGKKVSAIFKDKKNANKYNRNNPSDIKKLLDLAKKTKYPNAIDESVNEGKYDGMLDVIEDLVSKAKSFMDVGNQLKKQKIKYSFSTSMIPMYKLDKLPIAIVNKKYVDKADREVGDIAIGLMESMEMNEANSRDEYDAKEFWGDSKIGIQLHKQFKGRFNKSKFEKALSDLIGKSKRPESTIKIIGRYLGIKPSKLNSYTSGEIIEDLEFVKDSSKKAEQLYNIFLSSNESVEKLMEKNVPTNPGLWARAVAAAKKKYDVYPSAYANGFASKWYGDNGGKWKTSKSESVNERQLKGLDGIDSKTPLSKISDTQKLKIIQGTGNNISFKVPKGFNRNFWQVFSKGKIKKKKSLKGEIVYYLPGKFIDSPSFKSVKDLINGVDWDGVQRTREFNESVNEAKFGYKDSTASYINKHNDEYKQAEKINKGNEIKFYDSLEKMEDKIGHPKFMIFLSNALRGYGVDMYKDPKIKNPQDAQEALFLLSK